MQSGTVQAPCSSRTTYAALPFAHTMWRGMCDAGQLSLGGLRDSARHGKVHQSSFAEHWSEHA